MKKASFVLGGLFLLLFVPSVQAGHFQLNEEMNSVSPKNSIEILDAPLSDYDIREVVQLARLGRFKEVHSTNLGIKYYDKQFWLKLPVENITDQDISWYLEMQYSLLNYVDLYIPSDTPGGGYLVKKSGLFSPLEKRDLEHRKINFEIKTPKNSRQELYLRIHTTENPDISIRLWSKELIKKHISLNDKYFTIYFCIILTIAFFNILIWYFTRRTIYLVYGFYLVLLITAQMIYWGYQLLPFWPNTLWINGYTPGGYFTAIFAIQFSIVYLEVKTKFPRIYIVAQAVSALSALLGILALFIKTPLFGHLSVPILLVMVTCTVIVLIPLIRQKFSPAYYYLCAKTVHVACFTIFILAIYGWIPVTYFTLNAFALGTLFEIIIFSFGLTKLFTTYEMENNRLHYKNYRNRAFPHFLFNSLYAVYGVIEEKNYSKAKNLIQLLTEIYHFITYKSLYETTSLTEELSFCEKYMSAIAVRFDHKVNYETKIEINTDQVEIPPFLVQSFLENAMKHGYNEENPLYIKVYAQGIPGKQVTITIENNGTQLAKEPLAGETIEDIIALLRILYHDVKLTIKNTDLNHVRATINFSKRQRTRNIHMHTNDNLFDVISSRPGTFENRRRMALRDRHAALSPDIVGKHDIGHIDKN